MSTPNTKELLLRAAQDVRALKARIAQLEAATRVDPTTVVGLACRFPQSPNANEFWQLMASGRDGTSEAPDDRPGLRELYDPDPDRAGTIYTRRGGFVESALRFDPAFFGIAARDAKSMDPQHALLLQVAWEAIEDAGLCVDELRHARVGVFIGITSAELTTLTSPDDPYALTGVPLNAAAGRIAHTFGLRGPALAVDTACSSSLVAVHLAHRSLQSGEIDLAIAGGVNLLLSPLSWLALSRSRALAADGRCKTFDAEADGYGRGEGCGIVIMSRHTDAIRARSRIYAAVLGSAVNHNGGGAGMTVPTAKAQEDLIRRALDAAGIGPTKLGYIEAHGTGTALGDPSEVRGLTAVLGEARPYVGTAKVNIGHLESAAGIAGMIRVLLCMKHGQIPPHVNMLRPNPHIAWPSVPFRIADELTDWPRADGRVAGVSSFGASGTNAHLILGDLPLEQRDDEARRPRLLCVSAPTARELEALSQRVESAVARQEERLEDVAHTLSFGRHHWKHRRAILAESIESLREANSPPRSGPDVKGSYSKIGFLFPGQGSLVPGIGRALYERFADYRSTYDEVAKIAEESGVDLAALSRSGSPEVLTQSLPAQLLLLACELAMLSLLRSCRVEASVVAGHSLGEYAAAYAAGALGLHDVVRLVARRASLMDALARGGMLSALCPYAALLPLLEGSGVEIACRNAPDETVVAGRREDIAHLAERLRTKEVRHRILPVTHAFHSEMMTPILDELGRYAASLDHREPRVTFVSTMHGRPFDRTLPLTGGHWPAQLRAPVRFDLATATLLERGADVFVEVGPGSTLIGLLGRSAAHRAPLLLPSLTERDEPRDFLRALGALYEAGFDVRIPAEQGRIVSLPGATSAPRKTWDFSKWSDGRGSARESASSARDWLVPSPSTDAGPQQRAFRSVWNTEEHALLGEHRLAERVIVSAAFVFGFVRACLRSVGHADVDRWAFSRPLHLRDGVDYAVEVVLTADPQGGGSFAVSTTEPGRSKRDICSGTYRETPPTAKRAEGDGVRAIRERCPNELSGADYYAKMWSPTGHDVRGSLRRVKRYWWTEREALAELTPANERQRHDTEVDAMILTEVIGQVARTAFLGLRGADVMCLARGAGANAIPDGAEPAFLHAICTGSDPEAFTSDVHLLDHAGRRIGSAVGISLAYVTKEAFAELIGERDAGLRAELAALPPAARQDRALHFVCEVIDRILGRPEHTVAPDEPIERLGMDSFALTVLRSSIQDTLGIRLAVDDILRGTPRAIAATIGRHLPSADSAPVATAPDTRWLVPVMAAPKPRARVVCFPGGGGGPLMFHRLAHELLDDGLELLAVQLPGREARRSEPPATTLAAIRENVARELADDPDVPLVVVGHSMGASLAYDLVANGLPPGRAWHLVLISGPSPDRLVAILQAMPKAQADRLVAGLADVYGEDAAREAAAADRYVAQLLGELPPRRLEIPTTMVWGESDFLVSENDMSSWHRYVAGAIDLRTLPCSHSPPTEVPAMVAAILRSILQV